MNNTHNCEKEISWITVNKRIAITNKADDKYSHHTYNSTNLFILDLTLYMHRFLIILNLLSVCIYNIAAFFFYSVVTYLRHVGMLIPPSTSHVGGGCQVRKIVVTYTHHNVRL